MTHTSDLESSSVMRLHNLLQVGDQHRLTHTSDLESAVDDVPPQQVGPSAHSHPTSSTLHLCSCSTLDPILKQSYLSGYMAICTMVPTVDCGLGSRALPNASVFIQVLHRQTNTTPLDSLSPRCNTWIQAPSWDDTSCRSSSSTNTLCVTWYMTHSIASAPSPSVSSLSTTDTTCTSGGRTLSVPVPSRWKRMNSIQRALFVPPLDLNPPIPVDTITQSPRWGMARARESILGWDLVQSNHIA